MGLVTLDASSNGGAPTAAKRQRGRRRGRRHFMHYNFARPHQSLGKNTTPGDGGGHQRSRLDVGGDRLPAGLDLSNGNAWQRYDQNASWSAVAQGGRNWTRLGGAYDRRRNLVDSLRCADNLALLRPVGGAWHPSSGVGHPASLSRSRAAGLRLTYPFVMSRAIKFAFAASLLLSSRTDTPAFRSAYSRWASKLPEWSSSKTPR